MGGSNNPSQHGVTGEKRSSHGSWEYSSTLQRVVQGARGLYKKASPRAHCSKRADGTFLHFHCTIFKGSTKQRRLWCTKRVLNEAQVTFATDLRKRGVEMRLIPAIPPKFCVFNAPAFSHSPFHSLFLCSFHFLFPLISFSLPSFETLPNSTLVTSCNLREKVSVPASLQLLSHQVSRKEKKKTFKKRSTPHPGDRHLSKSSSPNTPTVSLASRLFCSSCFCAIALPQACKNCTWVPKSKKADPLLLRLWETA